MQCVALIYWHGLEAKEWSITALLYATEALQKTHGIEYAVYSLIYCDLCVEQSFTSTDKCQKSKSNNPKINLQ